MCQLCVHVRSNLCRIWFTEEKQLALIKTTVGWSQTDLCHSQHNQLSCVFFNPAQSWGRTHIHTQNIVHWEFWVAKLPLITRSDSGSSSFVCRDERESASIRSFKEPRRSWSCVCKRVCVHAQWVRSWQGCMWHKTKCGEAWMAFLVHLIAFIYRSK